MIKNDLVGMLRCAFLREGGFDLLFLRDQSQDFWRDWIEARLRGQDPLVPYARDEFPETAAYLFIRYAEEARGRGVRPDKCAAGAAAFLTSLQPSLDRTDDHLLRNAMLLVGRLRPADSPAGGILKDWIHDRLLLGKQTMPLELHRTALFALSGLQKKSGDGRYSEIWKEWLHPRDDLQEHKYAFVAAAFAGLAMSQKNVPEEELLNLIELKEKATREGADLRISPAILALWVDRKGQSEQVISEILQAISSAEERKREQYWETVRLCGDRAWPEVGRPYQEMRIQSAPISVNGGLSSPCLEPWQTGIALREAAA